MLNKACVVNLEAPGAASTGLDSTTKLPSACRCRSWVSTISNTSTPAADPTYLSIAKQEMQRRNSIKRLQAALTYKLLNERWGFERRREGNSAFIALPRRDNSVWMVTAMVVAGPNAAIFPDRSKDFLPSGVRNTIKHTHSTPASDELRVCSYLYTAVVYQGR